MKSEESPSIGLTERKLRFLNALRATGPLREQLLKEGVGYRRILSLARSQAYGQSGMSNRENVEYSPEGGSKVQPGVRSDCRRDKSCSAGRVAAQRARSAGLGPV